MSTQRQALKQLLSTQLALLEAYEEARNSLRGWEAYAECINIPYMVECYNLTLEMFAQCGIPLPDVYECASYKDTVKLLLVTLCPVKAG